MDLVYYRCEKCGFTHQVPEYWSGYSPEDSMDMEHIDLSSGELCEEQTLVLVKEG